MCSTHPNHRIIRIREAKQPNTYIDHHRSRYWVWWIVASPCLRLCLCLCLCLCLSVSLSLARIWGTHKNIRIAAKWMFVPCLSHQECYMCIIDIDPSLYFSREPQLLLVPDSFAFLLTRFLSVVLGNWCSFHKIQYPTTFECHNNHFFHSRFTSFRP